MPRRPTVPTAVAAAAALAALLATSQAAAVTCFVVMDRNDNVIYRDVMPPLDLSDAGITAREAMRGRGEFLLFHEAEFCPRVEFLTGQAGSVTLTLDQTMAPSPPPRAADAAPLPVAKPAPVPKRAAASPAPAVRR